MKILIRYEKQIIELEVEDINDVCYGYYLRNGDLSEGSGFVIQDVIGRVFCYEDASKKDAEAFIAELKEKKFLDLTKYESYFVEQLAI